MRIAIYEPEPRICGPMMWAWEVRGGLRRKGHEVDVVTSTKSGRPSSMWGGEQKNSRGMKNWMYPIDVVVRDEALPEVLDSYDLIIMPDVMSAGQDKDWKKWQLVPKYIQMLSKTRTKFISGLHGNFYTPTKTPCLDQLLSLPNRSEIMYTNSPNSLTSDNILIRENTWEPIHLPYSLKLSDEEFEAKGLPPRDTVGATGRFIFNKGQPSLALAGYMIDPSFTIELWGACSAGLGPSPTYVTFEGMINLDPQSQRKRYGNDPEDRTGMGGNIVASYLWDFKYTTGTVVRYLGVYSDPVQVTSRLGLHLGLTVANFSGGLVEFASLEAMDAGSTCMVLPNISRPEYALSVLPEVKAWSGVPKQVANIEQLRFLADRVNAFKGVTEDQRMAAARHNRATVRRLNDPGAIGESIIEMAMR